MANCNSSDFFKKSANLAADENETCPAVGYQKLSVCVPVEVKPFAVTGSTTTVCCKKPTVTPGKDICQGEKNGACYFTISQEICVEVPVAFGAEAVVGDTFVDCIDASVDNICLDCNKERNNEAKPVNDIGKTFENTKK